MKIELEIVYTELVKKLNSDHEKNTRKLEENYIRDYDNKLKEIKMSYESQIEEINSENEIKLIDMLDNLRYEMKEVHTTNIENIIREKRKEFDVEINLKLRELRNVLDEEHSLECKDLIEKLGTQNRFAHESQTVKFEKERLTESEKMRDEINAIKQEYEQKLVSQKIEQEKLLEKYLSDQGNEFENKMKDTVREKERASEKALKASSAILEAERESFVSTLRAQQVRTSNIIGD